MKYEWDETKDWQNRRKHGISFEVALQVFDDEHYILRFDRVDETGEGRWKAIGMVSEEPGAAAVLTVVHAYRESEYGEDIIRIISARKADKSERRTYQEQEMD